LGFRLADVCKQPLSKRWEGKAAGLDAQVRRPICNAHYPLRVEHQRKLMNEGGERFFLSFNSFRNINK